MSYRKEKIHSLTGINLNNISNDELKNLCKKYLEKGIHGLCFSAYDEGQEPGDQISDDQIRRKLKIIQPYIKWVRTFSDLSINLNWKVKIKSPYSSVVRKKVFPLILFPNPRIAPFFTS